MNDSRLIRILKTFDKEELRSFEKFLNSPLLKPLRNINSLYEYLIKFYPEYDSEKLQKEKVFERLFKGVSYNEKKLINLMSELTKAAESFMAYNMIMNDETEFLISLSKAYMKKNLSSESGRINKLIEKKLLPGFSQNKDYFSKFRKLSYLKSSYYTGINDFEKLLLSEKDYFETSAVQFIIDYTRIIGSINTGINTYGINLRNNFIDTVIKSFDLEKLLKALENSDHKNKDLILLHYYILRSKTESENISYYEMLRDKFYELLPVLDREEKCFIFNHLLTYCVLKFGNKNIKKDFLSERLEVYKAMLENEAYSESESEFMQVLTYRNIIHTCISLKEAKWFEYFIEKYSDRLHPDHIMDLKNYAFAHLYFMNREFEKSLKSVSEIRHEFFLFKADLKNIMLQIYYELDHVEQAFSMVDSYKHFLANNNEVSKSLKKFINNFLKYYFSLLKIKTKQNKESPSFYKDKIEKEKEIINKFWLLEKADELVKV